MYVSWQDDIASYTQGLTASELQLFNDGNDFYQMTPALQLLGIFVWQVMKQQGHCCSGGLGRQVNSVRLRFWGKILVVPRQMTTPNDSAHYNALGYGFIKCLLLQHISPWTLQTVILKVGNAFSVKIIYLRLILFSIRMFTNLDRHQGQSLIRIQDLTCQTRQAFLSFLCC